MHNPLKALPTLRSITIALTALTLAFQISLTSYAQKPQDRLLTAAAHAELDSAGLKPWHLKLDVTLYDLHGNNPVSGTIEHWDADNGNRTVFTFGDAKRVVLNNSDKYYVGHSGPEVPALADGVLDAVLRPGPSSHDVETASLDTEKTKLREGSTRLRHAVTIHLAQRAHRPRPLSHLLHGSRCAGTSRYVQLR